MRVVALLGPGQDRRLVSRFEFPGVCVFSGNDLHPTDNPAAALVFGGDGTLHRHLPALIESSTPVLHVPCGSGNDFAVSLGLKTVDDAIAAWECFVRTGKNTRLIDAGVVTPLTAVEPSANTNGSVSSDSEGNVQNDATAFPVLGPRIMQSQLRRLAEQQQHMAALPDYFGCVASIGFDSEVNRRANAMPAWIRKRGGYILAALSCLFSYRQQRIRLSVPAASGVLADDGWTAALDEPALLVAIGNTPHYGSGMRITHRAQMDDGVLDICFVCKTNRFKILRFLPSVFRGAHLAMQEVHYLRGDRFRIHSESPLPLYADGEPVCYTPVEIKVVPGVLKVIVP